MIRQVVCWFFGHKWSMWSDPGAIYKIRFRWCRRCNRAQVKTP